MLSGGEKALTAISLIFAIFLVKPSPFCFLDEVDAPLDDVNVVRFTGLITSLSYDSQFIIITHNKKTMEIGDLLYGVTMEEPGISKTVSVEFNEASRLIAWFISLKEIQILSTISEHKMQLKQLL